MCITLATNQITYGTTQLTDTKYLVIYAQQPLTVHVGDTIVISDVSIKEPTNIAYMQYMIKQNIAATIFAQKQQITVFPGQYTIQRALYELRSTIINHVKNKLSSDAFYLFSSLFLGNKQEVQKAHNTDSDQCAHDFKKWGLSHYLARSGLHLVIFIFLWQAVLGYLPCAYWFKQLALLFITFVYALLSWSSISFMRALATFTLCKLFYMRKQRYNFINILALVSIAFLIYNPLYLFFLDFQLSFLLTFGLAWHSQVSTCNNKI